MEKFNVFLNAPKTIRQLIVLKKKRESVFQCSTTRFCILSLILFSMLPLETAKSQDFECFVISPPEKILNGVRKIAILNFENFNKNAYYDAFGGKAFVDYLTSELLDDKRGIYTLSGGLFSANKPGKTFINSTGIVIFQLIEREQLYKVLNEKNLGTDVPLSDNQASEIGKVMGIDAFISGTIKHNYKSNRTRTDYQNGTHAYFTENICETEINVKIVSVATAQILGTKTFTFQSSDKKGGQDEGKVLVFDQLAPKNLQNLSFMAANYIAPFYRYVKLEFQRIKVKEFKESADQVTNFLKNEDLASAYALYKAIYDADNYNADAACNIGGLYFITGDYVEFANWNEIAAQINPKKYGKNYETAKKWAIAATELRDMGIAIEKYDFSVKNASDLLAKRVTTKGKNADRFDVYAEPSVTAAIVSKVPGSSEFVVIDVKGDFILIKLLGGKEGYISKTNIK